MTIYNFGLLNIPFANGAPSNEIAPFPDYNRGLGIAFEQTDGKPEMKGLNGLFNIITGSLLYLRQRGIAEWSANYEYPAGSFVTSGSALYKAKKLNTNKPPATSQTDWQLWASVSDITVSTNGNLKKTNNANGSIHLEVPTGDTAQRGVVRFANATEVANKSNVSAAINPSNVKSMFTGTRSTNGYEILPSGLILQWGTTPLISNNGTAYINFPITFLNSCLNITASQLLSRNANYAQIDNQAQIYNVSRSGFSVWNNDVGGAIGNMSHAWFAIGY